MHTPSGNINQPTYAARDSRIVSEATYGTYRSSSADDALIVNVSQRNLEDGVALQVAIKQFRRLVNEKKRGFDRLIQASGGENKNKNYIRARLEVQKDDPECVHILKRILQKHDIAVPLFMGDWLVTRNGQAQAEACGTRKFADIQTYMTQWYYKHGLISDEKYAYRPSEHPDKPNEGGGKLVHLSLGCGSGDIMLENQSNTDTPFGKGKGTTTDFWSEVGLCDKIYFSLSALLRGCLKPGHTQGPILELCDFLTTCINRDIQIYRNDNPRDIHLLEIDINYLKEYLLENGSEYSKRIKNGIYRSDGEFPNGKNPVEPSSAATKIINSFISNPRGVLDTYFRAEFHDATIDGIAPFLFHNIFVRKFEEFDEVFSGDEPRFHMITSVRGSSHIDNIPYKNLIRSCCRKMKPGAIIPAEDGIRRSYTRECRWREMVELAEELGDDYKFHFIKSSNGDIISLFIQRVGITPKGERVHLSPQEIRENITGPEGGIAVPINNYAKSDESEKVYLIRAEVRSTIMAALLGGRDRKQSDWNSLLKLGQVQDAIDGAESAINQTALQHIPVGKGDTKKAIKDYIEAISRQVIGALGEDICHPKDAEKARRSLENLTERHKQGNRVSRKSQPIET